MLKKITTFGVLLLMVFSMYGQRNCGSMEYLEQQLQEDSKRGDYLKQIEEYTRAFLANPENRAATVVTIPVVVHVVYNNSSENISDAQINTQMQVLTDDFRRLNSDADGTWSQAADTEIEFCLATVDPNGNTTTGVTRTSTSTSSFSANDNMKFNSSGGKDAWPAGDYMNMWVCDLSGTLLGYAQFPGGSASTDGVVIDYQYFGTSGTATFPFDLGRTATHEVGHWLNLRHIWGDGGCGVDDFVADTPTSDASNGGCALGHVSCGSVDMVQNYMDYSDDACMNLYTLGQKTRMQALFGSGGARASLLSSNGCGSGSGPTCSDGIQNGDETGVDCGGSCTACGGGCTDTEVTISITLDNYPGETTWNLKNASGTTLASGGPYSGAGSTVSVTQCLTDGCYDFTINDSYGDGICCSYGNGSYTLSSGGTTYASGGAFGSIEVKNFCIGGGPAPTCSDGIQNGNETGVDCGGPDCAACPTCSDGIQNGNETGIDCGGSCTACPTCNDGIQNGDETGVDCGGSCSPCGGGGGSTVVLGSYFESGWDGWTDGGNDCARYSGSRSYEGNYSIRIRDNSGTASSMTTSGLNLAGFSSVEVEFFFYAYSMENGEDFWLRYNDGSGWNTVASYARGTSFNNNTFYTATVTLNSSTTNLVNGGQFRFQCDASANNDHIYIDAVTVTGISGARTNGEGSSIKALYVNNSELDIEDLRLSPNPVSQDLFVRSLEPMKVIKVYSSTGQLVRNQNGGNELSKTINMADLKPGVYIITVETEDELITKRFIKN